MHTKHHSNTASWIFWVLIILLFFWIFFKGIINKPRYNYDNYYLFPECGWY